MPGDGFSVLQTQSSGALFVQGVGGTCRAKETVLGYRNVR